MKDYAEFLASKGTRAEPVGIDIAESDVHPSLFPFQRALVKWAAKRGRAALFCNTGLGKTRMQIEFGRVICDRLRAENDPKTHGGRGLILAPLAVGRQTINEGASIGVPIHDLRSDWTPRPGLNIVNYDSLHKINPDDFDLVVLDESSILKNFTGKMRAALIAAFARTPYRLCCSATPAPNDAVELGNHSEFLGIMREIEMRATWFVHDEQDWRLKGHAAEDFYRWLASWAMFVTFPSDLGFDDTGYILPPLDIGAVYVPTPIASAGSLFFTGLGGVQDRAAIRKGTVDLRVAKTIEMVNADDEPWIVWCGLNAESEQAANGIRGAVEVTGSMSVEEKEANILAFTEGRARVLVSKVDICGFGMNWQHCASIAFLGLSDSYEAYYQAIRRCYRFGQTKNVRVRIVLADVEAEILQNVKSKEEEASSIGRKIVDAVRDYERQEIGMSERERDDYVETTVSGETWTMHRGDCVEVTRAKIADESIDFSIFSPPFSSLFTYSNSPRDIGNTKNDDEFFRHFDFLIPELLRVMKPGRLVAVHVANVPAMMSRDGYIGVKDLRGDVIRHFQAAGFIFHGEVTIDKCPQAQAIRTKSKSLLFVQKERDSSWLRPALADYIIVFRKPGENAVPIQNADVTRENWIEWARPIWYGINESDTLQAREAREDKDEKHLCPLQLGTIERCVRLWSNRGDLVFSPFGGIGSEPYQAIKCGRRAVAIELKGTYFAAAVRNLMRCEKDMAEGTLFGSEAAQ